MLEKLSTARTFIDVLDRVLDKGIVFDAWVRISMAGIDLITADTHVKIASIDVYTNYWPAFGMAAHGSSLSPSTLNTTVSEAVRLPRSPVLFIIAADRPDLFEKWTAEFPELAVGHAVILDRRRHERRQELQSVHDDHRRVERRTHKIDRELELFGLTVVVVAADA